MGGNGVNGCCAAAKEVGYFAFAPVMGLGEGTLCVAGKTKTFYAGDQSKCAKFGVTIAVGTVIGGIIAALVIFRAPVGHGFRSLGQTMAANQGTTAAILTIAYLGVAGTLTYRRKALEAEDVARADAGGIPAPAAIPLVEGEEVAALKGRINELTSQLETQKNELSQQIDAKVAELTTKQQELALKTMELQTVKESLDSLRAGKTDADRAIELESQLSEVTKELQTVRQAKAKALTDIENLEKEIVALKNEKTKLEEAITKVRSEAMDAAAASAAELAQTREGLESEITELTAKAKSTKAEHEAAIAAKEQESAAKLNEEVAKVHGALDAIKQLQATIAKRDETIKNLQEQLTPSDGGAPAADAAKGEDEDDSKVPELDGANGANNPNNP